jgi:NAD(P)-dependent dehydrogenase (short-subunit alcohol dehydrogenase family)
MSTVLIIGASRGIGFETIKLALKAGHSVRAMVRSATAIRLRDPKLKKLTVMRLINTQSSVR